MLCCAAAEARKVLGLGVLVEVAEAETVGEAVVAETGRGIASEVDSVAV